MGKLGKYKNIAFYGLLLLTLLMGVLLVAKQMQLSQECDAVEVVEDFPPMQEQEITVTIKGEVAKPGKITVKTACPRVIDVINAAGGLTQQADVSVIPMADKVSNKETILIPPKSGYEVKGTEPTEPELKEKTANQPEININTATKEELISLPGIGDTYATRIIDYRTKHPFKAKEEILNIKGIGQKKYEKLAPKIKIE